MMIKLSLLVALVTLVSCTHAGVIDKKSGQHEESGNEGKEGTMWAVLMAGSKYYYNYRHQADLCHAYQLLKKGGLKDENIITMMYDDIANSKENPDKGKLYNRPGGPDVYKGMLKDYTGDAVTADNFFAILQGNSSATKGGSGKVLASGPNDHVFVYFTDHGAPGFLVTPSGGYIQADKLNAVLRQMHKDKRYKSLLFYVEACESGSIFEGLLSDDLNIYALTAANSTESSWATYCNAEPFECLGDLFSVAWMEDVEAHNIHEETLEQEYENVKKRTLPHDEIDVNPKL